MPSNWEPSVNDAAVRSLLTPTADAAATDAARQITYLKLRVRLRDHVRRAGLVIDALIEDCVDLTMARILVEFGPASATQHFAGGGELRWVFAVATLEAAKVLRSADMDLIATSLAERSGDIAAELEPKANAGGTGSAVASGDGASGTPPANSRQPLDAVFDCVRSAIGLYLTQHRTSARQENLAMYLRFTFTKIRQKDLGRLYARTPGAVNQRISLTRRELTKATAHCFNNNAVAVGSERSKR